MRKIIFALLLQFCLISVAESQSLQGSTSNETLIFLSDKLSKYYYNAGDPPRKTELTLKDNILTIHFIGFKKEPDYSEKVDLVNVEIKGVNTFRAYDGSNKTLQEISLNCSGSKKSRFTKTADVINPQAKFNTIGVQAVFDLMCDFDEATKILDAFLHLQQISAATEEQFVHKKADDIVKMSVNQTTRYIIEQLSKWKPAYQGWPDNISINNNILKFTFNYTNPPQHIHQVTEINLLQTNVSIDNQKHLRLLFTCIDGQSCINEKSWTDSTAPHANLPYYRESLSANWNNYELEPILFAFLHLQDLLNGKPLGYMASIKSYQEKQNLSEPGQWDLQSQTDAQVDKSLSTFESLIISGSKPTDKTVFTQYEPEQRVIQWRESLIKHYKYSDEAFDNLGYEKLQWNTDMGHEGETYRNCKKGILIEVKEYDGQLSITMKWFPQNVRRGIGYLMTCP